MTMNICMQYNAWKCATRHIPDFCMKWTLLTSHWRSPYSVFLLYSLMLQSACTYETTLVEFCIQYCPLIYPEGHKYENTIWKYWRLTWHVTSVESCMGALDTELAKSRHKLSLCHWWQKLVIASFCRQKLAAYAVFALVVAIRVTRYSETLLEICLSRVGKLMPV